MDKNWNYILNESNYIRTTFRVYPYRTFIHSFNDDRPKTWDEVYKVYYSWAIIHHYKDDNGKVEPESGERLLYMYNDECSNVVNLHHIIRHVVHTGEDFDYPTIGMPAGDWKIEVRKGVSDYDNVPYEHYYFSVFDNWLNNGYRFIFDREKALAFADWLEKMNERALIKCGCPI